MKKILLYTVVVFICTVSNAQEKGKFRFGLDIGYPFSSDGGGFLGSLEAKYNLSDNSSIGLLLEVADYVSSYLDEISITNYLATYDYYFHKEASSVAPFLGAGAGVYSLRGYKEVAFFFLNGLEEVTVETKFGVMIRGGIEFGKFRLALAYNIIPKTDFEGVEINNSYFGASIGFYVGGGKWKLN